MKLGIFAYGSAGCKIAERFKRFEIRSTDHVSEFIMAADTSKSQLNSLSRIDKDWQLLYGQKQFEGRSTRADLEPAVDAAQETVGNIASVLNSVSKRDIDAFLVIGSLGGGTGGGGAPVCAKTLSDRYERIPVYGVGILPSKRETDVYTLNAARSLQSFSRETDNLLLFDNDHLGVSEPQFNPSVPDDAPHSEVFQEVNQDIARCLHMVFTADERVAPNHLGDAMLDTDTLTKVLGTGGLSTMCYATQTLPRAARPGLTGRVAEFIEYLRYKHADRKYDQQARQQEQAAHSPSARSLGLGTSEGLSVGTGEDSDVESRADGTLLTSNRGIEITDLPAIPQDTDAASATTNTDSYPGPGADADTDPDRPSLERDWPHPTKLLPLTLDTTSAMMDMNPAHTSRNLFLLAGPANQLSTEQAVATADWAGEHTASGFPVAKAYPMKSKKVSVLTVCSGIGLPDRINELQAEAEQIAERILNKQSQRHDAKDVNVFENSGSKVPPSFGE